MDKQTMKLDSNPQEFKKRAKIRKKLQKIMQPILRDRLIPFIRERYGNLRPGPCCSGEMLMHCGENVRA